MLAGQLGSGSSTSTSMHRAYLCNSWVWGVGTLNQSAKKNFFLAIKVFIENKTNREFSE